MIAVNRLVWVSRDGKEEIVNDNRRGYTNPRISPDGQRIVVQAGDLWMQESRAWHVQPADQRRDPDQRLPIWMPDGRVMYRSQGGLRMQGTNGPGDGAVIPGTTELDYPSVVAPDGDTLVFHRSSEATSFDILSLSLRDPSRTSTILNTPAYESGVQLSARWPVAVVRVERNRTQRGLPDVFSRARPARASVDTGRDAGHVESEMAGDLLSHRGQMIAVDLVTSPSSSCRRPRFCSRRGTPTVLASRSRTSTSHATAGASSWSSPRRAPGD